MYLKVYVKFAEEINDPNLQLISRGFPKVVVGKGGYSESAPKPTLRETQSVLVFDLTRVLTDAQRAFLDHVKENEHAIVGWEYYDERGQLADRG
jgi:hypothetical protein